MILHYVQQQAAPRKQKSSPRLFAVDVHAFSPRATSAVSTNAEQKKGLTKKNAKENAKKKCQKKKCQKKRACRGLNSGHQIRGKQNEGEKVYGVLA